MTPEHLAQISQEAGENGIAYTHFALLLALFWFAGHLTFHPSVPSA